MLKSLIVLLVMGVGSAAQGMDFREATEPSSNSKPNGPEEKMSPEALKLLQNLFYSLSDKLRIERQSGWGGLAGGILGAGGALYGLQKPSAQDHLKKLTDRVEEGLVKRNFSPNGWGVWTAQKGVVGITYGTILLSSFFGGFGIGHFLTERVLSASSKMN